MPTSAGFVDPFDPVFISYRQFDGTHITSELAWMLRSAGVPVWRDRDDLPPGDTDQRLAQAIEEGISAAVLVVTRDLANSRIVKEIEAPRILSLHTVNPAFALGIVNDVEREPGTIDYSAPDRVLGMNSPILLGVDQQGSARSGLRESVRRMVFHRIAQFRPIVQADAGTFRISLQTRNTPQVYDRTDSQLDIRVRPSTHERLPSTVGLEDLKDTIALLPDSVTRADARRVVITGGAHASVAFAIGAALPSSRVGEVTVFDQQQRTWQSGEQATFGADEEIWVTRGGRGVTRPPGRPAVAIYLDLLDGSSDAAFDRFLEERADEFVEWKHLTRSKDGLIDPEIAGEIASEAAAHIRKISTDNDNAEVHLLLRTPFPMAVLIGRLTNTLRLDLYEWDDSDPIGGVDWRPRYVPALRLRTSATDGVIREVLLPRETTA